MVAACQRAAGAIRELLARDPWRGMAITAVAAAAAAAAVMIAAKVACILSVASTGLGRRQLGNDTSVVGAPAWFAADLRAGLWWGLLIGATLGPARRPRARLVANAVLVAVHVALAAGLLVSVTVYQLFGVPPTWQLLGALSDPGNTSDSVATLITVSRVLFFLLLVGLAPIGFLLARGLMRRRPRVARRTAAGLAGVALLCTIAAALAAPSRFELDRNPVTTFLSTGLFGQSLEDGGSAEAGELARVVKPVVGGDPEEHDPAAYQQLARWARASKRNVVLVILETTAVKYFGVMGGDVPNTPTLSRLAEHGMLWARHYAHTPSSMFAIYSILGSNHGTPQGMQISATRPRIDCHSLPEVLTANGWRAGLFHSGRFSYSSKDLFLTGRGYDVLYDTQGMPNREKYLETSWGIEEQASIDAMLDWVKEAPGKPFFITYIPVYPHHPYPVPRKQYERFPAHGITGKYVNSVYYIDQMIDTMITGLDRLGVADDTLFVFVGDHGEGFNEHPGSQMHGSKLYDEAVHSFALLYAPGALDHGAVDHRPTGHVDIAPTVLDLLGLPAQPQHVGTSALREGRRPMVPLYTGYGHPLVGFVDGRWKVIHNRRTGRTELYDVLDDPAEREPRERDMPEEVGEWRRRANRFVAAQKAWEASLPDIGAGPELELDGPEETWVARPAECSFPASNFEAVDGQLHMTKAGEKTVTCEHDLPDTPGGIVGLTVHGNEAINAAFITAMAVWRGPSGQRRQVAYCTLNGNSKKAAHECKAKLVAGSTRLGGGGKLVLELRFVTTDKNPTFGRFGVEEVAVTYKLAR